MRSIRNYSHIFLATIILMAGSVVLAQDEESEMKRQKEIQEKEMMRQKEIQEGEMMRQKEIQEQEMMRQKEIQEQEMRVRKEMLEEQREQMRHMEQQYANQAFDMDRHVRESARVRSSGRSSGFYPDGEYLIGTFGQDNQSQLILRKSFRGTSNTAKGEFEVDPNITHLRCQISG